MRFWYRTFRDILIELKSTSQIQSRKGCLRSWTQALRNRQLSVDLDRLGALFVALLELVHAGIRPRPGLASCRREAPPWQRFRATTSRRRRFGGGTCSPLSSRASTEARWPRRQLLPWSFRVARRSWRYRRPDWAIYQPASCRIGFVELTRGKIGAGDWEVPPSRIARIELQRPFHQFDGTVRFRAAVSPG